MHYGSALSGAEDRLANLACNPAYDIHSKQPELKFAAVNLTKGRPPERGQMIGSIE